MTLASHLTLLYSVGVENYLSTHTPSPSGQRFVPKEAEINSGGRQDCSASSLLHTFSGGGKSELFIISQFSFFASSSSSVLSARLPPIRVEESSFSQDMQWLLERGMQFADVAFYSGDSGKELGWAHAAVLCAVSPYFRQLLLGPKAR